jgi:signal transduction histidine kinase
MTDVTANGVKEFASSTRNPWKWFMRWLRAVPIDDPVQWRNAPMMQILLLIFGIAFPLSVLPHWLTRGDIPIDWPAEIRNVATISVIWFSFWLVRRGHFRASVNTFISMTLVLMAISYQHHGLNAELAIQATQVFPIVLGGLLLGRRTLWAIVLALLAILGMGAVVDSLREGGDSIMAVINFIRCGLGFLVVGVILDRAVSALRETLELARQRGEDLQRTEAALRQEIIEKEHSQTQLIQAQKVEAVGRVSSGMAHDFNNILGVIMGYASRPDAAESLPVAVDSLDGIKLAAQRGGMAIRRVLGLGRSTGTMLEIVSVNAVITDMLPLVQQIFGSRVALHAALADEAMPVLVDRGEFELAMLNIATNARDAMPEGGNFTIEARTEEEDVHIVLSDDGTGMDTQTRERLFDLFYTTKPASHGSGIGLAVVKRFVDDAGGRIEVHSEQGQGTRFEIRLPLVTRAYEQSPQVAAIDGVRILLVEDDEALRSLLADALRAAGADVLAAGSGKQAVAFARKLDRLDVLISDFHLPDGTGNDVLAQIASMHPDTRCLIISANESLAAVRPANGQVTQLLAKPFAPSLLVHKVGTMLDSEQMGTEEA